MTLNRELTLWVACEVVRNIWVCKDEGRTEWGLCKCLLQQPQVTYWRVARRREVAIGWEVE